MLASGGDDKVVMLWRIDADAAPKAPTAAGNTRGGKKAGASPKVGGQTFGLEPLNVYH